MWTIISTKLKILSGLWMGWGLGSNDAANLFGTGVAAKVVKYRTATILIAIFVIAGAVIEGPKCMDTLGKLVDIGSNLNLAFLISLGAAISITVMSYFGLPVSTSQAIVGSLLGAAILMGGADFGKLTKIIACWVATPIGALSIALILYIVVDKFTQKYIKNVIIFNRFIKYSLIFSGCYGAYSLGANNVANTTAIYVGVGLLTPQMAALLGGISIAIGALTFSRKVMMTVGKKITIIGPLGALIATLSNSITIHIFTQIGVPVSSSQAIVGAVMGIGLAKGMKAISYKKIIQIFIGWISTPLSSGLITFLLIWILKYFKLISI